MWIEVCIYLLLDGLLLLLLMILCIWHLWQSLLLLLYMLVRVSVHIRLLLLLLLLAIPLHIHHILLLHEIVKVLLGVEGHHLLTCFVVNHNFGIYELLLLRLICWKTLILILVQYRHRLLTLRIVKVTIGHIGVWLALQQMRGVLFSNHLVLVIGHLHQGHHWLILLLLASIRRRWWQYALHIELLQSITLTIFLYHLGNGSMSATQVSILKLLLARLLLHHQHFCRGLL